MDAKVDDWVVTPRIGKPVEVNALWYNALKVMAGFARQLGAEPAHYEQLAATAAAGFQRFWNDDLGYCYDVLDGPDGHDDALRPNQLFAVSLPHTTLSATRQRAIVDICARHLLTSHGLRSLAPDHPDYRGRYGGDQKERDGAYHQGTVWSWLIGPFVSAHLRSTRIRYAPAHSSSRCCAISSPTALAASAKSSTAIRRSRPVAAPRRPGASPSSSAPGRLRRQARPDSQRIGGLHVPSAVSNSRRSRRRLSAGLSQRVSGDLRHDRISRQLYSTDASIFQVMPYAVLIPEVEEDVHAAVELAAAHRVPLLPRTAGSSLAGQAVNKALVIDFTRHLNQILELNVEEGWIWVQPGIVLDELNFYLRQYGLQFGPIRPAATAPRWAASSPTTPPAATPFSTA
jgi:hypothetical protein